MDRRRLLSVLLLSVFFITAFPGFAQEGAGIQEGADLPALLRSGPAVLELLVLRLAGQNQGWLDTQVDMHGVTEIPLEQLRAVMRDYGNYARWFRRCLASSLRQDEEGPGGFFALGVNILGVNLAANFVCGIREAANTEDVFHVVFTQQDDFSMLLGAWGEWYFERVETGGISCTYYRFRAGSLVLNKYPLQEWIIRTFGEGEFRDAAKQLLRAASKSR